MGKESASLPLNVCASPDELVRQLRTLPPVPKVLVRLQPMLADLNTDLEDLAAVIRLERALAARILQVSNSAFVGANNRARSIEEAIGLLGFREVRRLVTIVIGLQIMEKPLPAYGIDSRMLWRQSIACGLAAEEIAKIIDEDTNAAYALGLLHSVGMVVVNAWAVMVAKSKPLTSSGYPDDYTESERSLLGFTNADTGAALLRKWDFPPAVVEPVRAQYQPVLAASHGRLAHLLLVARWLRSAACEGAAPAVMPDARSMAVLGLTEETLFQILPIVRQRLDEASKLLGVN
jgi:HD-like signal output (HDOD) protein